MSRRVVAVLSGGGAKGAAHVGAVKALLDCGLHPAHFVGTSMGAVMAACFASGLPYEEVLRRVSAVTRRDVAMPSLDLLFGVFARSLLQPGPFRETLEALVPVTSFAELRTPLTVTAVDAQSGDLVLFGEGGRDRVPLHDALYASCALPMYYPPAVIGDREYVDGGLRAVLPLDTALEFRPSLVVGVSVGPSLYPPQPRARGVLSGGIIGVHRRALRLMMALQTEQTVTRWRRDPPVDFFLVQPRVAGSATFAVDRIVEFVEEGYRAARRAIGGQKTSEIEAAG